MEEKTKNIQARITKFIKKNQYEELIEYIVAEMTHDDFPYVIKILKKHNAFVDLRGNDCFACFINKITIKDSNFTNYISQVKILNHIFQVERNLQSDILKIPAQYRFAYLFLVLSNNYFKAAKDLSAHSKDNNGKSDKSVDINRIESNFSTTLKALMYDSEIFINDRFICDCFVSYPERKYFDISMRFLKNSSLVYRWHSLYESWKDGLANIAQSGNEISFRFINCPELNWVLRNYGKYSVYTMLHETEHALIAQRFPLTFTKDRSLDFREINSIGLAKNKLHLDNVDDEIKGIPLQYWIKAYERLIEYSKKYCDLAYGMMYGQVSKFIKDFLFIKSERGWIRKLVRGGVPKEYSIKLFKFMVASKSASDFFDFPFIPVRKKYLLCYSLLSNAVSGLILKSRFNQQDISYSKRGHLFEEQALETIKNKGIPVTTLFKKEKGAEYECDLAFVLDDVLFICELKDNGENFIRHGNQDFFIEDAEQLMRIGAYFENNKDYVLQAFNRNGYKVYYQKVIKLLVYNTYLESVKDFDGIKILDYDTFIAPIRRGNLDMRLWYIYGCGKQCMDGKYTAKKYLKCINTPLYVADYDRMWFTMRSSFKFGNLIFNTEEVTENQINTKEIVTILDPATELYYGPIKPRNRKK